MSSATTTISTIHKSKNELILPTGWTSEQYGKDQIVYTRPGPHGGFVTVDFSRRIYATGMGTVRFAAVEGVEYRGKDWRQRLVADAIAYLDNVMK